MDVPKDIPVPIPFNINHRKKRSHSDKEINLDDIVKPFHFN